jgi:hypothetical protein
LNAHERLEERTQVLNFGQISAGSHVATNRLFYQVGVGLLPEVKDVKVAGQ